MYRIPLTYDQRLIIHTMRKDTEEKIRALKKLLRGVPHTNIGATATNMMDLHALRQHATRIYAMLAASRGRAHGQLYPDGSPSALAVLREFAKLFNTYRKPQGATPKGDDILGLMLVEAETRMRSTPQPESAQSSVSGGV